MTVTPTPAQRSTVPPPVGKAPRRPRLRLVPSGMTPLREQPSVAAVFSGPAPVRLVRLHYPDMQVHGWCRPTEQRHGVIYLNMARLAEQPPAERVHLVLHEITHLLSRRFYRMFGNSDIERAAVGRLERAVNQFADHLQGCPALGTVLTTLGVLTHEDGVWLDQLAADAHEAVLA